jgi:hypothetical protein
MSAIARRDAVTVLLRDPQRAVSDHQIPTDGGVPRVVGLAVAHRPHPRERLDPPDIRIRQIANGFPVGLEEQLIVSGSVRSLGVGHATANWCLTTAKARGHSVITRSSPCSAGYARAAAGLAVSSPRWARPAMWAGIAHLCCVDGLYRIWPRPRPRGQGKMRNSLIGRHFVSSGAVRASHGETNYKFR